MSNHSEVSLGARHPIHDFEYANAAARTGDTGRDSGDIGKAAKQIDNDSYWILIATTPSWTEITGMTVASHALGGASHSADSLANLNSKITGGNLDFDTASRPPNGAASGDLGGTYPSPTVNDGADGSAIHDNVAAEISVVTAKATPVSADLLLIEDSAAANAKKRITMGAIDHDALTNFAAAEHVDWAAAAAGTIHTDNYIEGGASTDTTAIHDDTAAEISAVAEKVAPVSADLILIEDSAASNAKKRVQVGNLPTGSDADAIHDNVAAEISAITEKVTPVSADLIVIEDSAASNAKKKVQIGNLPGGAGGFTIDFDPNEANHPASNPGQGTSVNGHAALAYDDTTAESNLWTKTLPAAYASGSNISVRIDWFSRTATTGGVAWGVEVERVSDGGTALSSDSFDTQKIGVATTSASIHTIKRTTITLSNAEADAIAAGDRFRFRVQRVVGDAGDDMTGDAEIHGISMVQ